MSSKQKDFEWKNRVLCSDESCIGVIGPNRQCKECGLAYQGELPATFHVDSSESQAGPQTLNTGDEAPEVSEQSGMEKEALPVDADDEWAQRKLCIDESCIGVVGPDGSCKECGKPYPE